ncbi:MAG TPA: DUF2490 domain-containing protein [Cyclobacteriaceae bacterium]|nr:DUF2490 domain-containing protein [Cyclobacteriaceae bacterium]
MATPRGRHGVLRHLFLFFVLLPFVSFSQAKQTDYAEQAWFGYMNQTRLTHRSGIWLDLHLRLNDDFIKQPAVSILRGAYIFYLNDQNRLAGGYAYITQYAPHDDVPNIPEHRLWQQVQWVKQKNRLNLMQWVRLEERFRRKVAEGQLTPGYNFNYRTRYALAVTVPLKGKVVAPRTPFVFVNNELMINFGSGIVYNYFDQNRFFAGVGYQFTGKLNAHLGYLKIFQQLPEPATFRQTDAVRLFVFHNLDFRSNG